MINKVTLKRMIVIVFNIAMLTDTGIACAFEFCDNLFDKMKQSGMHQSDWRDGYRDRDVYYGYPGFDPGYGMGPGQGPGGYGMGQPPASGAQPMGPGYGGVGYGMPAGGYQPGMMAGATGGPGTAMLNSVGAMDLTNEQRSQFNAIREQLQARQQELVDKLRAEDEKMRKLQEEQLRLGQTMSDLQGHLMQAAMDAANHAEELLTEDQRQAMIGQGRHVMMRPVSTNGYGQRRGESE